jgi:uncharacterized damage-inducible protein DinB
MAQYATSISTIQDAPSDCSAENVLLRMVEGAGFRYYWSSEGLSKADLEQKPCEECRSMLETLQHIASLSEMVKNTVLGETIARTKYVEIKDFNELIEATNKNWADAANYLKAGKGNTSEMPIIFNETSQVPFWNLLNGPLADAIYHTGQVVTLRRMSGNPINPKVNVFMGKLND